MRSWTAAEVGQALRVPGSWDGVFGSISTDSRSLRPGALFVALSGARYDGHDFLAQAQARGAAGAVVRHGTPARDGMVLFEVDDTLAALGSLARARRREVRGPVVAVTGTNGKTATKELLAAALRTRWQVHATRDNLNNLVGVPLTILDAPAEVEALVVEAGASVPGEIARLRDIIEPVLAVVTNVSAAHTEGLGSVEGVLREKLALVAGVTCAVVGTEPPELAIGAERRARRVVVAGTGDRAQVRPDDWRLDAEGRGVLRWQGHGVTLPLVGHHQVENAVLALAAAAELGVDAAGAVQALRNVRLPPGRCQVLRHGERTVVHDAYNANPASLAALLETAEAMRGARPLVVVLGSMLELGAASATWHDRMADAVLGARPALVAVTGLFVPAFRRHQEVLGDRLLSASDPDALGRLLAPRLTGDELVVVKGSRGVRLERAICHLIPGSEDQCSTTS